MAVRENDMAEVEKGDPERGCIRDQQVGVSRVEEDLLAPILDQQGERRLSPEVPADDGRVLDQDRDLHSTPR
jgi:hypothetical protein